MCSPLVIVIIIEVELIISITIITIITVIVKVIIFTIIVAIMATTIIKASIEFIMAIGLYIYYNMPNILGCKQHLVHPTKLTN